MSSKVTSILYAPAVEKGGRTHNFAGNLHGPDGSNYSGLFQAPGGRTGFYTQDADSQRDLAQRAERVHRNMKDTVVRLARLDENGNPHHAPIVLGDGSVYRPNAGGQFRFLDPEPLLEATALHMRAEQDIDEMLMLAVASDENLCTLLDCTNEELEGELGKDKTVWGVLDGDDDLKGVDGRPSRLGFLGPARKQAALEKMRMALRLRGVKPLMDPAMRAGLGMKPNLTQSISTLGLYGSEPAREGTGADAKFTATKVEVQAPK